MTDLRISDDLSIPPDAVTQTFGILAVRGAGKTNTAVVMAEEMYKAQLPFVFIDPVGVVWGLRSAADGESPGLEIPIFGGRHGDLPLERTGGQLIADLVVDERLSCVLDLSDLNESDKVKFLTDFALRLYRRNTEPLHLFLDEADDYIPQANYKGKEGLLGAFENIVRRGRARGLGMTMISQRSAVINKNVLTQVETLIAMRIASPQDRKAIEGWIEYHGSRRDVLESLGSMETGTAWVWSPNWLGTMQQVKIRPRQTFDSSATPKSSGKARTAARLADIDLSSIQQRMAATIERAKTDDPKELQKRIGELERLQDQATTRLGDWITAAELSGFDTPKGLRERIAELEQHTKTVEVPVLSDEMIAELKGTVDSMCSTAMRLLDLGGEIRSALVGARQSADVIGAETNRSEPQPAQNHKLPQPRGAQASPVVADIKISGPQQRILDALAEMEAVGLSDLARSNVAVYSDASPKSSAFGNNLGSLRSSGYLDYPAPNRVSLTDAGRELANLPDVPRTLDELHESWCSHVSGPQARILRELIIQYPVTVERNHLADLVGASATSSAYGNNLGHLRGLGLISYPAKGMVAAAELLFPEGLR